MIWNEVVVACLEYGPGICLRVRIKPFESSVRIDGVSAEIRTGQHPNAT
jgi:hypothetical protein